MITIKRANVVLSIEEDELDKYFEKGYSVIDQFGNVVKASVPTEVGALQRALQDEMAKVAALEKQIKKLKADNEALLKANSGMTEMNAPEDPTDGDIVVEEQPKKKSSYKRKTQQ